MDIERKTVSFPVDANLQQEVAKLALEGWQIAAESPPVTVYHLVRVKGVTAQQAAQLMGAGAEGTLSIDDDKVFIMGPDGRIRKN